MPRINSVIIAGRLVRNPDINYFQNGNGVMNLSLVQNNYYKSGEEFKEPTVFAQVKYFAKQEYIDRIGSRLHKASVIYVEGSLAEDRWEDKDGGEKVKTYIKATRIQVLSKDNKETSGTQSYASKEPSVTPSPYNKPPTTQPTGNNNSVQQGYDEDLDDLPF